MYKASELREKSREELLELISELKGKLLALRFEAATGQLQETHLPKATKKDIALAFTVLKEKETGIVIETKKTTVKPVVKEEAAVEAAPVVEETTTEVVEETTTSAENNEESTTTEGEAN